MSDRNSIVATFANFKGGTGKTTTTALTAYNLAKMGKKVLVIDFDAQANLTDLYLKTKSLDENVDVIKIERGLMGAIVDDIPLQDVIINIRENLDLVGNAVDFGFYPRYLERNLDSELDKVSFFRNKIEPLKDQYDFIFIDVPPTLSLQNDTAFYACDEIIVVLQTQERALNGAEVFIEYLQTTLIDEFDSNVDIAGILPVLSKKGGAVDERILEIIEEDFGSQNIFNEKIHTMERLKRMDMTGITDNESDIHDQRVHEKFTSIAKELLSRLNNKG